MKTDGYYTPKSAALIRKTYEEDFDTFKYSTSI
jgi:hypothetical protein